MYCAIPDSGLALFLADGDRDAAVTREGPETSQIVITQALAIICLGVIALWS